MRTWNRVFWLCLAGTILLAAGVIFLPRYFSRGLDLGKMNQVQLAERENFSFLEQSSNAILENARAFRYLNSAEDNLMLVSSYDESAKINMDLLEGVYDEVMKAADEGMLPWLGSYGYSFSKQMYYELGYDLDFQPYEYWADMVRFANYYSLTYQSDSGSNTKEMLNFWYLRFSDGKTFDYYFLVNAVTYQIYYAEIHNQYTDWIVNYWESFYKTPEIYGDSKTENSNVVVYDDAAYLPELDNFYWFYYDITLSGCVNYYNPDDFKNISSGTQNNRMFLHILNYGNEALYIEQLAMPENTFPYRGISIGLQNMGENIQKLMTQ